MDQYIVGRPAGDNRRMTLTRRQFLASAAALPAFGGERVQVLNVPDGGLQPQVSLGGDALHLIYFTGDPKHGDILYRRSTDFGRNFTPPLRVNSRAGSAIATGSIRGAQIALGKRDRVHVAWNGSYGNPRAPMLYARLSDGDVFDAQRNLMGATFGLDGGGSVAADRHGNVYVAWHGKIPGAPEGEAGRRVWIARSGDDGGTFAPEHAAIQEATGACGCCGMRIFAATNGEVLGLYRSAAANVHRDIYLIRSADLGKTFSVARLHPWETNACPMSSMAFTEATGEVLGAWETHAQVYFAPVSRGAAAPPVAPPGTNPKRKYPALARNRRGETLLAWVEGSGWQRGGQLGWQIFDPSGKPSLACSARHNVPTWSFPAAFCRPDDGFTIIV
jgi:hypothetical protein